MFTKREATIRQYLYVNTHQVDVNEETRGQGYARTYLLC